MLTLTSPFTVRRLPVLQVRYPLSISTMNSHSFSSPSPLVLSCSGALFPILWFTVYRSPSASPASLLSALDLSYRPTLSLLSFTFRGEDTIRDPTDNLLPHSSHQSGEIPTYGY